MKGFLRTIIIIFSVIIVAEAVLMLFVASGILTAEMVSRVAYKISSTKDIANVTYGISIIFAILGIIAVFGSDTLSSNVKGGVILPGEIGAVQIANQTFENIITNVTKKYGGIKTAKVEVKLVEDGLMADIFAYVLQDTVISDITSKLQEDIKDTIIKQTTVAVKNVNVKIKGTYTLAEPKE